MVLDDVWRLSDAQLLNVANQGSRVIISTRDANIAHRLGASVVVVPGMEQGEALRFFARRADIEMDSDQGNLAQEFLRRVDCLPLAVELGAAQVASGRRLGDLLEDLAAEVARLGTLDTDRGESNPGPPEHRRTASLEACFALSIRRLEASLQRRFDQLGILREEAEISPTCARILFGAKTDGQALDTLRLLAARALLTRTADPGPTFRMHDLLRDYARRRLAGAAESDSDLVPSTGRMTTEHESFLDRCRKSCTGGRWSTLPADAYLLNQLFWHARLGAKTDVVHEVLEEHDGKAHGWVSRRMESGQIAELANDLAQGASVATQDLKSSGSGGPGLQRLVRYGLLHACLLDHGTWTPAPLVVRMVEAGQWALDRGLSYARVSTSAPLKVWTMASLAKRFESRWDGAIGEEAVRSSVPADRMAVFTVPEAEERLVTSLSDRLRRQLLSTCIRRGVHAHAAALAALGRHASGSVEQADLDLFDEALSMPDVSDPVKLSALARVVATGLPVRDGIERVFNDLNSSKVNARDTLSVVFSVFPRLDEARQIEAIALLGASSSPGEIVGFLRLRKVCLVPPAARALLRQVETFDDRLVAGWALGLLAGRLDGADALRSGSEALRLLAGAVDRSELRFQALTDVGVALGGDDGVGLELAGIRAGIEAGLGNVGVGPLQEYARAASPEGLAYFSRQLLAGTDWDRVQGLPGVIAAVAEERVREFSVPLAAAMKCTGTRPNLLPCYHRLPDDLLPALVEAAKHAGPTAVEYEALAALARAVGPEALQTIAEDAQEHCGGLPPVDRLQVAAALAPECTIYDPHERAGRLAGDLKAAFDLEPHRISLTTLAPGQVGAIIVAAPDAERRDALYQLSAKLDRLPDYLLPEAANSLAPHLSPFDVERLAHRADRLEPAKRSEVLAALCAPAPHQALCVANNKPPGPPQEREFAALFKDIHGGWGPGRRQLEAAEAHWKGLAEQARHAEMAGLFDPTEQLGKAEFLRRLKNLSFALAEVLDHAARTALLDTIQGILREVG